MYQLTCPSCLHTTRSPFVRPGAVVDCARCGARYTIGAKDVARQDRSGGFAAGAADPLLDQAERDRGQRQRVDAQGNVVGLSGLSNLMKAEASASGEPRRMGSASPDPDAEPPAGKLADPGRATGGPSGGGGSAASRRRARQRRRFRLQRSTSLLVGGLCGMVVMLGLVIFYANRQNTATLPAPEHAVPENAPAPGSDPAPGDGLENTPAQATEADGVSPAQTSATPPPPDDALPVLQAVTLTPSSWTFYQTPEPAPQPDPTSARVWLINSRIETTRDGRPVLRGQVVSSSPAIVARAELRLMLVNADDQLVAEATQPIAVLPSDRAMAIRVPLPPARAREGLSIRSKAQAVEAFNDGRLLDQVRLEPRHAQGLRATRVRITVPALGARSGAELSFLISAMDQQGHPLARWHARWPRPVDPDRPSAFMAYTPLPQADRVARWSIIAVAVGQAPVDPNQPAAEKAPATAAASPPPAANPPPAE